MEAAKRALNDPVHGNDAGNPLKMGIERQASVALLFSARLVSPISRCILTL
jgi:hypothetical protein